MEPEGTEGEKMRTRRWSRRTLCSPRGGKPHVFLCSSQGCVSWIGRSTQRCLSTAGWKASVGFCLQQLMGGDIREKCLPSVPAALQQLLLELSPLHRVPGWENSHFHLLHHTEASICSLQEQILFSIPILALFSFLLP